ncbi:DUF4191 domain-containing protein [Corynebacterium sp. ES2794-CONJ1]|uniref:DUF4191 domain-containing protein n=1 Tax=unclassified Corynebacterium TaxID=2624378 RepID=UPI0021674B33|nr:MULTISPECIES: DUF4191 domain-containing protein [unclassified Corynebacterium]MCS4490776.1 DUF4191 domain-containing protein [Corynebacterium sp. ES2775-CONJ]MCS4492414.1 DUF4191 domain-containing protein [Corynebacterium sp. ES2715-CONJ3]MCS4532671.1 DUF4191 domain-containing protein [Corynebacterium sp. ES2730-CONJ]MCU9518705.1 DUF4191 domain-containing protein [Corynebacterium sp. ES2794-CONJ1]
MADPKVSKKEQRAAKRAQRRQTWSQLRQAFNMQRKQDKALVPLMLLSILGMGLVFFLIGVFVGGQWFMLALGLSAGLALAMWVFSRRLQNSVYNQASDQPGAAGWALENLRSGLGVVWKTKPAVASNTHMDFVHRTIGVCGIVLVGEGEKHRLEPLFKQQEKRLNRLVPGVPVTRMIVGDGEDEVPLRKLQSRLVRLKRIYKKDDVYEIAARVDAMDKVQSQGLAGIPKGPLPKGGRVSGMNRRARRHASRQEKP